MPNIVVQIVPGVAKEDLSRLAGLIAEGGNAAFGLPADRINIYFDESIHYRGGVLTDAIEESAGGQHPTTTFWVNTTAGKTIEQKRVLVQHLTDAVVDVIGGSPDDVVIYINEAELGSVAKNRQLFIDK